VGNVTPSLTRCQSFILDILTQWHFLPRRLHVLQHRVSYLKLNDESVFCVARTKQYDGNNKLYVEAQVLPYTNKRYLFRGGEFTQMNESTWLHDVLRGRSRWWPHGLRRGSAVARLLGLRFRILPGAWISDLYVLCCLCDRPIPRPEESYRVCMCHLV
jgi:hypothetical protein